MPTVMLLLMLCLALVSIKALHLTFEATEWREAFNDSRVLQAVYNVRTTLARIERDYWRRSYEDAIVDLGLSNTRRALWRALRSIQTHKERWLLALEQNEWLNERYADLSANYAELVNRTVDLDGQLERAYGLVAAVQDKLDASEFLARHYEQGRQGMHMLYSKALQQKVAADTRAVAAELRAEQAERQVEVLTAQLASLAHEVSPMMLDARRTQRPQLVA